jgi:5'-deoxynucleotidase YfbR-like HD superfamily hydrolase
VSGALPRFVLPAAIDRLRGARSDLEEEARDAVPLDRARIGDWATTSTGRQFWPQDPRIGDVCLEDIAHALAFQCRFAGATWTHYSIAQHSVLVSRACKPENALVGLLHDATEAYLQDIIKPLKRALTGYIELERAWSICIGLVFGLSDKLVELPQDVHAADRMVYAAEWRDLMPAHALSKLSVDEPRWPDRIDPWTAERAKAEFLRRFRVLGGSR